VALAGDEPIGVNHLRLPEAQAKALPIEDRPLPPSMDDRLRDELIALLHDHSGNVAAVARVLGKGRMQIHRWLRKLHVDPDSFRR
jgi:transcriptional regulator of acetoin/glycerol metabolism